VVLGEELVRPRAVGAHDRLDGLVNAAGVVAFGSLADTDDEVIEDLFLTNVLGPLWLMRAAISALTESRGFIANISAVVAEQPLAGMAAYAASKAALTAADRALARELRAAGISVTDARPPLSDVVELLARREFVEAGRRQRHGLGHPGLQAKILSGRRPQEPAR
jgi:cyclic-di-GMP-binding biofilm dispersal mediator protein